MKSWMKWFVVGILVFALAACGNDTKKEPETGGKENDSTEKQEKDKEKDELIAAEIFKKALAATGDQTSMHFAMDTYDKISIPESDYESDATMNVKMDLIFNPFASYQVSQVNMDDEDLDLEWYATDEDFYLHIVSENQWVNMPEEDKDEMLEGLPEEIDHFAYLELFEAYADEFIIEETDDAYTMKLEAYSDKFEEIVEDLIIEEVLEEGQEAEIGNLDVKKFTFEFSIAKDTFYLNGFDLDLDASLEVDGEETLVIQTAKVVISKLNEIENIEIPQEVIENAIEYNEEDFEE